MSQQRFGDPVRTTCPYCGVGCGVLATPQPDGSLSIAGDPEPPRQFRTPLLQGIGVGRNAISR